MITSFAKNNITINNLIAVEDEDLQEGLFIVVINFDKLPPHLALLFNGKYYDLSFKGLNAKTSFASLYSIIKSKAYPTLFFKCPIEFDDENDVFDFIDSDFNKYTKIKNQHTTCLNPIKESIVHLMGLDDEIINTETIFEFIEQLNNNYVISESFIYNYPLPATNSLVWNKYSRQQLNVSLLEQQ